MQLRAVGRRCSTGSATVLGDIAQGTTPWATPSWDGVARPPRQADAVLEVLDRGFRVPAAVIDFAARLLPSMAPGMGAPTSVRDDPGSLRRHARRAAAAVWPAWCAAVREALEPRAPSASSCRTPGWRRARALARRGSRTRSWGGEARPTAPATGSGAMLAGRRPDDRTTADAAAPSPGQRGPGDDGQGPRVRPRRRRRADGGSPPPSRTSAPACGGCTSSLPAPSPGSRSCTPRPCRGPSRGDRRGRSHPVGRLDAEQVEPLREHARGEVREREARAPRAASSSAFSTEH